MSADDLTRVRAALADRFTVDRELGSGGMAVVYLAQDLRHGRGVALKVLRPDIAAALGGSRFLREIQIAARLSHPHIVPLFDSGEVDGLLYYVMPFVDGESLRVRLEREGRLPVAEAVQVAREVAEALDYAHREGVVHRDIKPENILLQQGHAVVADFGIARAISIAAPDSITQTGIAVGTPAYMSPEQITGETVDGRCDLYGLGCVLYESLAGEPPFDGPTVLAILARQANERAPSVRRKRPDTPPSLDRAVQRALSKTAADRFASGAEFSAVLAGAAPVARRRAAPRGLLAVAAVLLVVALAGVLLPRLHRAHTPVDRSIAVIPFRNQSGETSEQYFTDGLTDELIGTLASVPGLRVASHTSVFAFRNAGLDSRAIASRLKASALIEGSVSRSGESLQVSVQLINSADGFVVWSEQFREQRKNVFAVEDRISQAIASRLAGNPKTPVARVHPTTGNVEAYDLYLKGRWLWNQRVSGPPVLERAIDFFSQAIALDSNYARAYAGLADAYSMLPAFGNAPTADAFAKARAAVDRALVLDSSLAEAHTSLGIIHVFHDWDWDAAGREFARALELDSTEARTHLFHAWYYNGVGDFESMLRELQTALRLDPTSPVINARFGSGFVYTRRYREAETALRRAVALDSTNLGARAELSRVLSLQGRNAEAIAMAPKQIDLQAGYLGGGTLGYILARAGRRAEAEAVLQELQSRLRTRFIAPEAFAFIEVGLGDTAAALDWLERGYRERSFYLVLIDDPFLDPLRGSPRFEAIVRGVGLHIPPAPAPH